MTDDRARDRTRDSRIPPHNLDAERAALGAALLNHQAVEAVVSIIAPADYYKPAHGHIARAVGALASAPDPQVDTVTVAEQLRRDGMLDEIGGIGYLVELQTATPAISAAAHYARIVKNAAVLRRLIATASEISDLGYGASDDPTAAIVRAGELLTRMDPADAATLSTLERSDLGALIVAGLHPEQPTLLTRSDGGALLYPGKMHTIQAEPSSGKTWLALWAIVQILAMGGAAGVLDYEDTPVGITTRLIALGASPRDIAERVYYARPLGRFGPAERLSLDRAIEDMNLDLVVIDGVGESLSREGLSEDKADDVIRWTDLLPRPIARTGAAVLMIDHVAKDPEQRGRWARGSGAKLAAVDGATYQLKVRQPFSRNRPGRFELIVAKDRPGGVGSIGEHVATVHVEPHAGGERVVVRIDPYTAEQTSSDSWKPSVLMGKAWEALNSAEGATLTATGLRSLVHGKPRLVSEAISRLIAEGFIAESGKPKRLHIVKQYNGSPAMAAPAWRAPPPDPELFATDREEPTAEELAELERQPFYSDPDF